MAALSGRDLDNTLDTYWAILEDAEHYDNLDQVDRENLRSARDMLVLQPRTFRYKRVFGADVTTHPLLVEWPADRATLLIVVDGSRIECWHVERTAQNNLCIVYVLMIQGSVLRADSFAVGRIGVGKTGSGIIASKDPGLLGVLTTSLLALLSLHNEWRGPH